MVCNQVAWTRGREYDLDAGKLQARYRFCFGKTNELSISGDSWRDNYLEIILNPFNGGVFWSGNPNLLEEHEETLMAAGGLTEKARCRLKGLIDQFYIERHMIRITGCRMSDELECAEPVETPENT